MMKSNCPACGAPIPHDTTQCPYCDQWLRPEAAPQPRDEASAQTPTQSQSGTGSPASTREGDELDFEQRREPREGAFTLMVPRGWQIDGGIFRAGAPGGAVEIGSIEAKVDLVVKKDEAATVALRACPESKHCDLSMSPAGMMGFFQPGSSYQGMTVSPVMSATEFLQRVVFPWAHPEAREVEVVSQERMPLLCDRYRRKMASLGQPADFELDGGAVTFRYVEEGVRYLERAYTVVENLGPMFGGMWSNKDTVLMRAPEEELDRWEPVLLRIVESVEIDRRWLAREAQSQGMMADSFLQAQRASNARDRAFGQAQRASQARDQSFLDMQHQVQEMDQEMVDHQMRTNAEIQNDEYLNLMGLEEYENPYTNEVDVGSNEAEHRWVNTEGESLYTDEETFDPNVPGIDNRTDWVRSKVRRRFPF